MSAEDPLTSQHRLEDASVPTAVVGAAMPKATELPCPCGQSFAETQAFVEHSRSCTMFAYTASSFAEAAKAAPSGHTDDNTQKALDFFQSMLGPNAPASAKAPAAILDLSTHAGNNTALTCPQCKQNFNGNLALLKHFDNDHAEKGNFHCKCGSPFDWLPMFLSHAMVCQKGSVVPLGQSQPVSSPANGQGIWGRRSGPNGGNPLSCSLCGKQGFQYPTELLTHFNHCKFINTHGPGFPDGLPSQSSQPANALLSQMLPQTPSPAGKTAQPSTGTTKGGRHQDPANDNTIPDASRPFKCDHCVKSFKSKALLDQHMHIHFPPKYTCRYCSKKYRWPPVFYHHQRTCKKRTANGTSAASGTDSTTSSASPADALASSGRRGAAHTVTVPSSQAQNAFDFGGRASSQRGNQKFPMGKQVPQFPGHPHLKNSVLGSLPPQSQGQTLFSSFNDSSLPMNASLLAMMATMGAGRMPWLPPLGLANSPLFMRGLLPGAATPTPSPTPVSTSAGPYANLFHSPAKKSALLANECACGAKFDEFPAYLSHVLTCSLHMQKLSSSTAPASVSPPPPAQAAPAPPPLPSLAPPSLPPAPPFDFSQTSTEDSQNSNPGAAIFAAMMASMNAMLQNQQPQQQRQPPTPLEFNRLLSGLKRPEPNRTPSPKVAKDGGGGAPLSFLSHELFLNLQGNQNANSAPPVSSNLLFNDMASALALGQSKLSDNNSSYNTTSSTSSGGEMSSKSPPRIHSGTPNQADSFYTSPPESPSTTCRHCGKEFSSRLALKQHVEGKHGTERRYKCPGCSKSYRWGASYYYHRKSCQAMKDLNAAGAADSNPYDFASLNAGAESPGSDASPRHKDTDQDSAKVAEDSSSDPEVDPHAQEEANSTENFDEDEPIKRPRTTIQGNPITALGDMLVE